MQTIVPIEIIISEMIEEQKRKERENEGQRIQLPLPVPPPGYEEYISNQEKEDVEEKRGVIEIDIFGDDEEEQI